MSFLSGILGAGKTAVKFLSGNSILAGLAKTALLGYAMNRLSKSALKKNDLSNDANIDAGVRLQLTANAENKIPLLYGSAFFGGNLSDAAMVNNNKTMWYSLVLTESTGNLFSTGAASSYTLDNVFWNNQRIVFRSDGITADFAVDTNGIIDRSLSGLVKVYFYAGSSALGKKPAGFTGAVPNATTQFPNWTTSTHAMTGLVFAIIEVDYNREKSVTGLGNVLFQVTNSMKTPGDVFFDYITNSRYGAGIAADYVLTADVTALNTFSLEPVAYDDQGTGAETLANRYQINGLLDTAKPVLENAERILSATASWLSYDSHTGLWGIVINKQENTVATFDDTTILSSISLSGTGLLDLYNAVKVEFPHRELRDSADFYNIELNKRNSNEESNTLNIAYDIINEPIQAQLLGLIELKQSRVDKLIQFTVDFSFYNLKAGDVVAINNARFNFVNKQFRILSINEVQEDDGALQMDITALEYDENVYAIDDLFRFTRSNVDGIITIGSIGVPGTPIVSKIEISNRPRLEILSTAPTGVVEALEYWLTFDVNQGNEDLRNFTLIGTERPEGGGVFASGTAVILDYANIGASNFFVKTRGTNSTTAGPFSAVSGLVEYLPQQQTDLIGENTGVSGGLLGALALFELLGKLADLFPAGEGNKSIFDRIFDIFKDETGTDIVGDAKEGDLVVAAEIVITNDGAAVTENVAAIDLIGPIQAETKQSLPNNIEVKIKDGAADKDILAWNDAEGEWQLISGCITCNFPEPPPPVVPCKLIIAGLLPLPSNVFSFAGDPCVEDKSIPTVGSYFIKFIIVPGSGPNIPLFAPLQRGIGNIELYNTDGGLEQVLTESDIIINNNVVELPFAPRVPGRDYYILVPDGIVTSCTCENDAFGEPGPGDEFSRFGWEFRTSIGVVPQYQGIAPDDLVSVDIDPNDFPKKLTRISSGPVGPDRCVNGNNLFIEYSEAIKAGTGTVQIKRADSGSVVTSLNINAGTITGNTVEFENITGLSPNTEFTVTAPDGFVLTNREPVAICDASVPPDVPELKSEAVSFGFTTTVDLALDSNNAVQTCQETSRNTSLNSNIAIKFNKPIALKETSPAFLTIFEEGGPVHQKIDLRGTFENRKYGNLVEVDQDTLYINPTSIFRPATTYYVFIDAGAVRDANCSVDFAGVDDDNAIRFSTEGIEQDPILGPTLGSVFIDARFGRLVVPGTGKLNIIDADTGEFYTQISSTHPAVTISSTPIAA